MKNFYLFLLIAVSTHTFGQELSYSGTLNFNFPFAGNFDESGYGSFTLGENDIWYFSSGNMTINSTDIPFFDFCYLESIHYKKLGMSCLKKERFTTNQLLINNSITVTACNFKTILSNFKPNNLKIFIPNSEVCAGAQVNLTALPAGYPNEAYHWQYSLDNQLTWIDVPNILINNLPANNSPTPSFTISDILGNQHSNYFDLIHFRLGYSSFSIDRPFTDPIAIKYSPCAPILVDRTYIAPDCKGGPIKEITAYFQRPLEPNETISPMQIIPYPKVNGDPIFFSQQEEITSLVFDATKNLWAYKFENLDSGRLINSRRYIIEYQAKKNGVPRGTLQSFEPFIYNDPTAVQFEIVNAENPLCHDGTGEIVISVTAGTGAYKFYDDTIEIIPAAIKGTDGFYHLKNLASKEHKIKVTDSNDCIDNGKYD